MINKLFRISILLLVVVSIPLSGYAQKQRHKAMRRVHKPANYINSISLIGGSGLGTYYGDLCDEFECFKFRPHAESGIEYRYNESISFRSEMTWARFFGTDVGTRNANRNLHFRSSNFEVNALVVYDIVEFYRMHLKRYKFAPFLYCGVGMFNYNPRAEYQGKWYSLRRMQTEGIRYKPFTLTIPYGGGFRYIVSPHFFVNFEVSYRWTFTDYIDDVSTVFVENSTFSDPVAAALADRTVEGGYSIWDSNDGGQTWAGGHQRGNSLKNDGYLLFGFKAVYVWKVTRQHYNVNSNRAKFRVVKSIKKK